MAAKDAAKCEPATTHGAVPLECLDCVRRTARKIAARGRQERRQAHLVAANEQNENRAHPFPLRLGGESGCDCAQIRLKRGVLGAVGMAGCAHEHVESGALHAKQWKQLGPHELAKPPLQAVSIHGRMMMARHDDPDARESKRGSENPDIEMHGPNSLPLSNDGLNILAPRQSLATRKRKAVVTRLRTCSEA